MQEPREEVIHIQGEVRRPPRSKSPHGDSGKKWEMGRKRRRKDRSRSRTNRSPITPRGRRKISDGDEYVIKSPRRKRSDGDEYLAKSPRGRGGGRRKSDVGENVIRTRSRRESRKRNVGGSFRNSRQPSRNVSQRREDRSRKNSHSRSRSRSKSKGGSGGYSSGGSFHSDGGRSDFGDSDDSDFTGFQPKGVLTLREAFEPLFKLFGMKATGNIFKDFGLLADALEDEMEFARAIFGFIFDAYDDDGSGNIEEDELGILIRDIGEATGDQILKNIPRENIRAIMDVLDDDGNGEIDKKEFVDYMVSWLELGEASSGEEDDEDDSATDDDSYF